MNPKQAGPKLFNPDWGIDLARPLAPIAWPSDEVILQALTLYQTKLRKPSLTVYLLDISGSMKGAGMDQLKEAMTGLLDPEVAGARLLQSSQRDISIVIPFNDAPTAVWTVHGEDPAQTSHTLERIQALQPGGGTDLHAALRHGLNALLAHRASLTDHLPAIILLTDGRSSAKAPHGGLASLWSYWEDNAPGVPLPPIFPVSYGEADLPTLEAIAHNASGRVFDGQALGLPTAFRLAKGYN